MDTNIRKQALHDLGRRHGVIQVAPPKHSVRQAYVAREDLGNHELVTGPLASPTGPGSAAGFKNVAGSQIAAPEVTNIYMGPFWGDQAFVEGFSQAVLQNGYLDPLKDLGTAPGAGHTGTKSTDQSSRAVQLSAMPTPGMLCRRCLAGERSRPTAIVSL